MTSPIPGAAATGATGPLWVVVLTAIGGADQDAAQGNAYQTFARISNPAVFQAGFDCYFGATDVALASVPCALTTEHGPPPEADVLIEWAGQVFPASSMQGMDPNSSMDAQQMIFEVPALFDATLACMDRKADLAIQISQTVSGVQYVSKPVNAPLLVKAGDIPCRSSP